MELGEVEHALSGVPGIRQSCVVCRERVTEGGTIKYLVGYYVPDDNYIASNDSAILDSWEDLYDTEYKKSIDGEAIASDFSGWNSYVTGEAFSIREMELWRAEILGIIKRLSPERVLEIGVGTGLLMYPLLSRVQQYTGLDISNAVIKRHQEYLKDQGYDVSLYHLKADQLEELPEGRLYDTIIVNSVCQYFPGIGYFNAMLDQAISRLSESGSIFLGDIRNYGLQKSLIADKVSYQGESYTDQDIERIAIKENELLISPEYFEGLTARYTDIVVKIHERGSRYENELSKYRYDVIITGKGQIKKKKRDIESGGYSHRYHNIPYLNQLSKESILSALSGVLPEYMIPSTLMAMERFPLT
ncbi:2-polyprenyl-3-methyl-5-hydroxy-6-metoxy-1,4-benzoquinol methylase, partial [Mucilaginibacter lappiensis]|nr:2-polyprenyl-3-methyl-5-hydroxy-6-metoxy-1,4-benzoquinol methylase [Mucilaginibacter lappiensis]